MELGFEHIRQTSERRHCTLWEEGCPPCRAAGLAPERLQERAWKGGAGVIGSHLSRAVTQTDTVPEILKAEGF